MSASREHLARRRALSRTVDPVPLPALRAAKGHARGPLSAQDLPARTEDPAEAAHAGRAAGLAALEEFLAARPAGAPAPPTLAAAVGRAAGASLGDVRVHRDPRAADVASALGARALAVGRDVLLGPRAPSPETPAGRRLLAHELAHAAASRTTPAGAPLVLGARAAGAERQADAVARAALCGATAAPGAALEAGAVVRRTPEDEGGGTEADTADADLATDETAATESATPRYTGSFDPTQDPEFMIILARLYDPALPPAERTRLNRRAMEYAEKLQNPAAAFLLIEGVHYTGLDESLTMDGSRLARTLPANYASVYVGETERAMKKARQTGDTAEMFRTGIVCNQAAYFLTQIAYREQFAAKDAGTRRLGKLAGNHSNWSWFQGAGALTHDLAQASQGDMLLNWNDTAVVSKGAYEAELARLEPARDEDLDLFRNAWKALPKELRKLVEALRASPAALDTFTAQAERLAADKKAEVPAEAVPAATLRKTMKAAAKPYASLAAPARQALAKVVTMPPERFAQVKTAPAKAPATPWQGLRSVWVHPDGDVDKGQPLAVDGTGRVQPGNHKCANHVEIVFDHRPIEPPVESLAVVGSRSSSAVNGVQRDAKGVAWKPVAKLMELAKGGAAKGRLFLLGRSAGIGGKRSYIRWPAELLASKPGYREGKAEQKTPLELKLPDQTFHVFDSPAAAALLAALPEQKKGTPAVDFRTLETAHAKLVDLTLATKALLAADPKKRLAAALPLAQADRTLLLALQTGTVPPGLGKKETAAMKAAAALVPKLPAPALAELVRLVTEGGSMTLRPYLVKAEKTTATVEKTHATWTLVEGPFRALRERTAGVAVGDRGGAPAIEAAPPTHGTNRETGAAPADVAVDEVAGMLFDLLEAPPAEGAALRTLAAQVRDVVQTAGAGTPALSAAYGALAGEGLEEAVIRVLDPALAGNRDADAVAALVGEILATLADTAPRAPTAARSGPTQATAPAGATAARERAAALEQGPMPTRAVPEGWTADDPAWKERGLQSVVDARLTTADPAAAIGMSIEYGKGTYTLAKRPALAALEAATAGRVDGAKLASEPALVPLDAAILRALAVRDVAAKAKKLLGKRPALLTFVRTNVGALATKAEWKALLESDPAAKKEYAKVATAAHALGASLAALPADYREEVLAHVDGTTWTLVVESDRRVVRCEAEAEDGERATFGYSSKARRSKGSGAHYLDRFNLSSWKGNHQSVRETSDEDIDATGYSEDERRILRSNSNLEGGGNVGAINTWDNQILSWGANQYSGHGSLTPLLARLRKETPGPFRRYFYAHGIDVESGPYPVWDERKGAWVERKAEHVTVVVGGKKWRGDMALQLIRQTPQLLACFMFASNDPEVAHVQIGDWRPRYLHWALKEEVVKGHALHEYVTSEMAAGLFARTANGAPVNVKKYFRAFLASAKKAHPDLDLDDPAVWRAHPELQKELVASVRETHRIATKGKSTFDKFGKEEQLSEEAGTFQSSLR